MASGRTFVAPKPKMQLLRVFLGNCVICPTILLVFCRRGPSSSTHALRSHCPRRRFQQCRCSTLLLQRPRFYELAHNRGRFLRSTQNRKSSEPIDRVASDRHRASMSGSTTLRRRRCSLMHERDYLLSEVCMSVHCTELFPVRESQPVGRSREQEDPYGGRARFRAKWLPGSHSNQACVDYVDLSAVENASKQESRASVLMQSEPFML
jgi:hypothetical protein